MSLRPRSNKDASLDWRLLYSQVLLRHLQPREVVALVSDAASHGAESVWIDRLIVMNEPELEEMLVALDACFDDIKCSIPTTVEARRIIAREYARQIVDGELRPLEGARKIWWELWSDCRDLSELAMFAGLASEIEDDPSEEHRHAYETDIVNEARKLLESPAC